MESEQTIEQADRTPGDVVDLPFDKLAPVIGVEAESGAAAPDSEATAPGSETAENGTAPAESGAESTVPDVGFSIDAPPAADLPAQARRLAHRLARELIDFGPEGWHRLSAAFALTTTAQRSRLLYFNEAGRQIALTPPVEALTVVAEHRELSAELGDGPWWRLELELTAAGELTVDHDYGDEPFPDDQLLAPEHYRADLERYPRSTLPTWLAAYANHGNRQSRTPQQAAESAREDAESGFLPTISEDDFPDFPLLWSRWAAISAAFVAIGSEWGPRMLPSFGWFEGSRRSGSSLYVLPGGRAVLSGGVWNAPELEAAYNGNAPFPRVYAGAPEWIANPVLNTRAAGGLLTFCYWWERGRWFRGDSPAAADLAAAVPGIWTTGTVIEVITGLAAEHPTDEQRSAVADFVAAAERRDVTRAMLAEVFGPTADLDAAHYQLTLAGVARTGPEPLPADEAIAAVRYRLEDTDTSAYPLDQLVAERVSVGWLVYVPTAPEEIAIARALYYVADDGVVEATTSTTPPSIYVTGFEERFRQRHS
ncbi:hypothetical protein [Nocardia inohanensis]|uniref:hypothetical protein n=1 Tax=Nocardia inohanensis TaxID=209246 RepID=UPI000ACD3069|nr:hypothetical protein [Nocardia inohanensis]